MLLRKLVHHHLQNQLWKPLLDPGNLLFEMVLFLRAERVRRVRDHRIEAWQGSHEGARPWIGQPAGRALASRGLLGSLAERTLHARSLGIPRFTHEAKISDISQRETTTRQVATKVSTAPAISMG